MPTACKNGSYGDQRRPRPWSHRWNVHSCTPWLTVYCRGCSPVEQLQHTGFTTEHVVHAHPQIKWSFWDGWHQHAGSLLDHRVNCCNPPCREFHFKRFIACIISAWPTFREPPLAQSPIKGPLPATSHFAFTRGKRDQSPLNALLPVAPNPTIEGSRDCKPAVHNLTSCRWSRRLGG